MTNEPPRPEDADPAEPEPNDDTTEDVVADEIAAGYERPPTRAIRPIRDPDDEPFVFRFEVGSAILAQLLDKLNELETRPLEDSLDAKHPGFYQLFLDGEPKYIGKTSRPIRDRLREHMKTLRGRISYERVTCRFAYVEDPSLVDLAEGALINFFAVYGAVAWNRSGFGSKVTGYGRGRTEGSSWGDDYPLDFDFPVTAGAARPTQLAKLINQVGRSSPITFSVPNANKGGFNTAHQALVDVPVATRPFNEWAQLIETLLSPGWRLERQPRGWYIVPV